jgi:hypothetical protein
MLFGRLLGWAMLLGGLALLFFYQGDWSGIVRSAGGAASFNLGSDTGLDYMSWALSEEFSEVLDSQWTALTLVILGIMMIWFCRRAKRYGR